MYKTILPIKCPKTSSLDVRWRLLQLADYTQVEIGFKEKTRGIIYAHLVGQPEDITTFLGMTREQLGIIS